MARQRNSYVYVGRAKTREHGEVHTYYQLVAGELAKTELMFTSPIHPSGGIGCVWSFEAKSPSEVFDKTGRPEGQWQGEEIGAWKAIEAQHQAQAPEASHVDTDGVSFEELVPFRNAYRELSLADRAEFIGKIILEITHGS